MRIAVFLQNRDFFGARLMHLPMLHALQERFANPRITLFSPYSDSAVFMKSGLAEDVFVYRSRLQAVVELLRRRPEIVLSLRPSSSWVTIATRLCGAARSIGFSAGLNRLLFTDVVARDTTKYRALNFMDLLAPLGISGGLDTVFRQQAATVQDEIGSPAAGPAYCMMPGGGAGEFKRWGIDNFLALCTRIKEREPDAGFIFLLGDDERLYIPAIEGSHLATSCRILLNRPVAECAAVILACKASVANDCGPSHIAQMLEARTVVIFSDHDGAAAARIAEWFHPSPATRVVVGAPGEDIKRISPDRVAEILYQSMSGTEGTTGSSDAAAVRGAER